MHRLQASRNPGGLKAKADSKASPRTDAGPGDGGSFRQEEDGAVTCVWRAESKKPASWTAAMFSSEAAV